MKTLQSLRELRESLIEWGTPREAIDLLIDQAREELTHAGGVEVSGAADRIG